MRLASSLANQALLAAILHMAKNDKKRKIRLIQGTTEGWSTLDWALVRSDIMAVTRCHAPCFETGRDHQHQQNLEDLRSPHICGYDQICIATALLSGLSFKGICTMAILKVAAATGWNLKQFYHWLFQNRWKFCSTPLHLLQVKAILTTPWMPPMWAGHVNLTCSVNFLILHQHNPECNQK